VSNLVQASTELLSPSASRAEGCYHLTGHRSHFPDPLPDKPRDAEKINDTLRTAIRRCAAAELPWPLFVHGLQGRGKSCAGLCAFDKWGGWYITVTDFRDKMIFAQKHGGERCHPQGFQPTVDELWVAVGLCHLFVLDELGMRSPPSGFEYEIVKRAADKRENRPAIFISNHNLDALSVIYDARIVSRLAGGTVVHLKGPDRRIERKE